MKEGLCFGLWLLLWGCVERHILKKDTAFCMVLFPSFNPTTFHFCFYFYIVFTLLLSLAFDEATRTSSPTTPTDALNAKKDT
jgi:hypothetical protein